MYCIPVLRIRIQRIRIILPDPDPLNFPWIIRHSLAEFACFSNSIPTTMDSRALVWNESNVEWFKTSYGSQPITKPLI